MSSFSASGIIGVSTPGIEGMIQELHKYSDELLAIKNGLETNAIIAPWVCRDLLSNSIKNLKVHAKGANDTCTKIGVIGMKALKGEVRESILDELRDHSRGIMTVILSIVEGGDFSSPLMDSICTTVRAMIYLLEELLKLIQAGGNVSLNASIGQVWKANERVQKLAETNKAAYRRSMLEVINVINETCVEFKDYLDKSKAAGGCKKGVEETDDGMDFDLDDFDMDDMGTYDAQEIPIVESALELINKQKNIVKAGLICVTEIANIVSSMGEGQDMLRAACYKWVAEIVGLSKSAETHVINLGSDLYSPIDHDAVKLLSDDNICYMMMFGQKIIHRGFDVEGEFSEQYSKCLGIIQEIIDI